MGRRKKYETEQEQLEAKRRWRREWYYRNATKVNKERMWEYYRKKEVDQKVPIV
jgi:hypothetical protein